MKISVELDQGRKSYGSVHKAGCKDLRDGEPMGDAQTLSDVRDLLIKTTGWDVELSDLGHAYKIAPCVKLGK